SDIPLLEYLTQEILDAGVDYVSIKALRNTMDDIQLLSEEKQQEVTKRIEYLQGKHSGKIFGSVKKTYQRGNCWLSPLHTVIDALAQCWICCYYMDRPDNLLVGNLKNDSFKSLWYSQQHHDVIDRIEWENCSKYDCRWHIYNQVMADEL